MITDRERTLSILHESSSMREALILLKVSGRGVVLILDDAERLIGIATDGDIRKALIKNEDLQQSIKACMTMDFVSVEEGTPRETVLKLLDERIRTIPVLDQEGCVVELVGSGYQVLNEKKIARARAPARISLAGGGTDYTKYYMDQGGAGLTCTIAKYSHAVLEKRPDQKISIYSHDFRQSEEVDNINELDYSGSLGLIKAGIKLMRPNFGFNLEIGCDFPPGSGLGGSASLLAALIGVFNEFREHKLDRYAIAEYAFEAERLELGVSGGWQDQYSTVFGGFNFLQFNREHNVVTPLRIEKDALNELEECFVLCHTDSEHLGAGIQDDNLNKTRSDNTVGERLKNITDEMKRVLLKGEYKQFSMLLDETWQLKKENNSAVSNAKLDNIYNIAIKAGATAGRLLGTGGGGYFLFFTPPFCRYRVIEALQEQRLNAEAVLFDHSGLSSWKSLK